MIDQNFNRRASDGAVNVLAERIDGLGVDMSEMKIGIAKMADALTKLAIVEERQTQTILAQERAFSTAQRSMLILPTSPPSTPLKPTQQSARWSTGSQMTWASRPGGKGARNDRSNVSPSRGRSQRSQGDAARAQPRDVQRGLRRNAGA